MKKFLPVVLFICICGAVLYAQAASGSVGYDSFSRKASLLVVVNNIEDADKSAAALIQQFGLEIDSMDIDKQSRRSTYTLLQRDSSLEPVLEAFEKLGITQAKNIETSNNTDKLEAARYEQEFLLARQNVYQAELDAVDAEKFPEQYQHLWKELRAIEDQIYASGKLALALEKEVAFSELRLTVSEKTVQYLDDDEMFPEFINMPGVESFLYVIENPESGQSAEVYAGGALRYLFTLGKSFFTVGILKPVSGRDASITSQANDIVTYSLGKDFYPRYLGQGKRTFLNPYSGFQFGGMVLTSEDEISHFFCAEPHVGVELFKNKYVIVDMRTGYLFPLDEDRIKTMRGLTSNFTVNIVF